MTRDAVVLYGGAFDPVHIGHLAMAEYTLHELGAAELRFLPAGQSPWKQEHQADFEQRRTMLEIALKDSPFRVDPREGKRDGKSWTVDTLRELRSELDAPLVLLIGADNLAGFLAWREPEEILQLATLAVINRPGILPDSSIPHHALNWPAMEISSSWLRQRIAGGSPCRYLLPDGVWEYIRDEGLYVQG